MNFRKIIFLVFVLAISLVTSVSAQQDSVQSLDNQINAEVSPNYERSIRYLETNMNNETQLFKVSVPLFYAAYKKAGYDEMFKHYFKYFMFDVNLTYERKVSNLFSIYISNVTALRKADITGVEIVKKLDEFNQLFNQFDFGARYYFLKNRRMRQGLSGNNMNGIYLGAAVEGFSRLQINPTGKYDFYKPDCYKINLGVQDKLNSWSFVDVSFFLKLNPNVPDDYINRTFLYSLGFNLKIGLLKSIE